MRGARRGLPGGHWPSWAPSRAPRDGEAEAPHARAGRRSLAAAQRAGQRPSGGGGRQPEARCCPLPRPIYTVPAGLNHESANSAATHARTPAAGGTGGARGDAQRGKVTPKEGEPRARTGVEGGSSGGGGVRRWLALAQPVSGARTVRLPPWAAGPVTGSSRSGSPPCSGPSLTLPIKRFLQPRAWPETDASLPLQPQSSHGNKNYFRTGTAAGLRERAPRQGEITPNSQCRRDPNSSSTFHRKFLLKPICALKLSQLLEISLNLKGMSTLPCKIRVSGTQVHGPWVCKPKA
ncbi:translation initiation factor IF-2-like [Dermochelys coriacea]|uniref:translation initiation factor IF-2-like n=1 Tax=Dermochelys coriacea TaxID=27794 RepID=UPI0018E718FB|nr:translation initiation factor IF-2-like [Dermochelys coriacea]